MQCAVERSLGTFWARLRPGFDAFFLAGGEGEPTAPHRYMAYDVWCCAEERRGRDGGAEGEEEGRCEGGGGERRAGGMEGGRN